MRVVLFSGSEIEAGVGQGVESKKGSALNLRNLFFKKLSFLLCNVATLRKKKKKSQLSVTSRRWKLRFE